MHLADREEIIENEMKLDPARAARVAVASYFFPTLISTNPSTRSIAAAAAIIAPSNPAERNATLSGPK